LSALTPCAAAPEPWSVTSAPMASTAIHDFIGFPMSPPPHERSGFFLVLRPDDTVPINLQRSTEDFVNFAALFQRLPALPAAVDLG
jgi:hypothetical protein